MSHESLPPLPDQFSVDIVRSDEGQWSRVFVDRYKRRVESFNGNECLSITIARADRGVIYQLEPDERTYFEFPCPGELAASWGDPVEENSQWRRIGTEQANGILCNKFEGRPTHDVNRVSKIVLVDSQTSMRMQIQAFNKLGQPVVTINYKNARLKPPSPNMFEVPEGYVLKRLG